jgi:diguanylate cyclase (GGDEF)-like protein/PAS domain S-box-containing protein
MPRLGNNFLEALLRTAEEGVVVQDASGRIIFCNPAAQRILGIAEGAIIGNSSDGLENGTVRQDGSPFPGHDHPAMVTLRTGEPCRNVVMGLRHDLDRRRMWISINSALIPGRSGENRCVFAVFSDITAHVDANHKLREAAVRQDKLNAALARAETYLRSVLHTIPDPVWLKDTDGAYLLCNPAFERIYGTQEAAIVGKFDTDFVDSCRAAMFRRNDCEAMQAAVPVLVEELAAYRDGRHAMLETIKTSMRAPDGTLLGVLAIARDITARKRAEEALHRLTAYQRAILSSTPIGVAVFGLDRNCLEANDAIMRIFGTGADALVGKSARTLYRDEASFDEVGRTAWPIMQHGGTYTADVPMQRADGTDIWVRQVARMVDPADPTLGIVVTMEDITERRRMEAELRAANEEMHALTRHLEQLARTDPLTGLANRRAFGEAIDREFQRYRRFHADVAVLLLDVDHFKKINDTHGHEAGDRALAALGSVLAATTRATDLAARFGGEEFVLLLPGTDLAGALELAERIRVAATQIFVPAAAGAIRLTVSIGAACFATADQTWAQAISRADRGMYRAKSSGRNQVALPDGEK